jgi:RNase E/G, Thioredoxin-like domain
MHAKVSKESLKGLTCLLPMESLNYLINSRRDEIAELEKDFGVKITLLADRHLFAGQFKVDIEKTEKNAKVEKGAKADKTESQEGNGEAEGGRRHERRPRHDRAKRSQRRPRHEKGEKVERAVTKEKEAPAHPENA